MPSPQGSPVQFDEGMVRNSMKKTQHSRRIFGIGHSQKRSIPCHIAIGRVHSLGQIVVSFRPNQLRFTTLLCQLGKEASCCAISDLIQRQPPTLLLIVGIVLTGATRGIERLAIRRGRNLRHAPAAGEALFSVLGVRPSHSSPASILQQKNSGVRLSFSGIVAAGHTVHIRVSSIECRTAIWSFHQLKTWMPLVEVTSSQDIGTVTSRVRSHSSCGLCLQINIALVIVIVDGLKADLVLRMCCLRLVVLLRAPCFIAAVEQKRKILADGNAAVATATSRKELRSCRGVDD
mmetsp:Transcript_47326/g.75265  ORF Transcript_47326/g.75265 Transcript_47326/m.75265 type:complete len:290 (-) Transcript_47326:492-1361(-)